MLNSFSRSIVPLSPSSSPFSILSSHRHQVSKYLSAIEISLYCCGVRFQVSSIVSSFGSGESVRSAKGRIMHYYFLISFLTHSCKHLLPSFTFIFLNALHFGSLPLSSMFGKSLPLQLAQPRSNHVLLQKIPCPFHSCGYSFQTSGRKNIEKFVRPARTCCA